MKAIDAERQANQTNGGFCIRLYSKDAITREAVHAASLLPCGIDEAGNVTHWDLATPNGKVQYCGIGNELIDSLAELLGFETIR